MTIFTKIATLCLLTAPVMALRAATDSAPADPTEPGCYVWMPSGCSNSSRATDRGEDTPDFWGLLDRWHDMSTQWVRDAHGIAKHQAGVNRRACEQKRRVQFNQWCQRDDAQMKFVAGLEPVGPTTPGCYVWFPSGCRRHEFHAKTQWRRIGDSRKEDCEEVAPKKYNSWCGNDDARTLFVRESPAKPKEPGCYVWMPTGCTRHPFASKLSWKLDSSSDGGRQALLSKSICEVERRKHWNNYCGEANARMFHVPVVDSHVATAQRSEEHVDEAHEAPASSDLPDAPDATASKAGDSEPKIFPVGAPAQPEKPGCYVWMPSGCQNQRFHAQAQWRPTPFDSADECASKGRVQYGSWCGNEDVQMLWVASEESAIAKEGGTTADPSTVGAVSSSPASSWSTTDVDTASTQESSTGEVSQPPSSSTSETESGDTGGSSAGVAPPSMPNRDVADEHSEVQEQHSAVEEPLEPGCYVKMPTGCDIVGQNVSIPKDGDAVYGDNLDANSLSTAQHQWRRDDHGIKFKKAGVDQHACEESRREQFNRYCRRVDIQMKFIAGMAPTKPMLPGCYVWLPTGCPKHHFHAKTLWRRTEETDRTECETTVSQRLNSWCNRDDAHTIFISKPPRKPTEPGCYVWMPSGCSQHPFTSRMSWKLDQTGDDAKRAASDKAFCEIERKEHWNKFCGESNARMAYISSASASESQGQAFGDRKYQ